MKNSVPCEATLKIKGKHEDTLDQNQEDSQPENLCYQECWKKFFRKGKSHYLGAPIYRKEWRIQKSLSMWVNRKICPLPTPAYVTQSLTGSHCLQRPHLPPHLASTMCTRHKGPTCIYRVLYKPGNPFSNSFSLQSLCGHWTPSI